MAASVVGAAAVLAVALQSINRTELSGVASVSDGDSLRLSGERIRLMGIDAPELGQSCHSQDAEHPCGAMAANHLQKLLQEQQVYCVIPDEDRYGRMLGRCHILGHGGSNSINRQMVNDGWALAYGDYRAEERQAREQGLGIWAWEFEEPEAWRRRTRTAELTVSPLASMSALGRQFRGWLGIGGHHE